MLTTPSTSSNGHGFWKLNNTRVSLSCDQLVWYYHQLFLSFAYWLVKGTCIYPCALHVMPMNERVFLMLHKILVILCKVAVLWNFYLLFIMGFIDDNTCSDQRDSMRFPKKASAWISRFRTNRNSLTVFFCKA